MINFEYKIILIFLLKAFIYLFVLTLLPAKEFGLYAFLFAVAANINRLLDFGTSEGIIAHEISEKYLDNLYEILKIKSVLYFILIILIIVLDAIFVINIPFLILFCTCYLIVFFRDFFLSILFTIEEKKYDNITLRSNQALLAGTLQIIIYITIYVTSGNLSIEQLTSIFLFSLLVSLIILLKDQIKRCFNAKLVLKNLLKLFRENFFQHLEQIKISWIAVINKLLEANILFFITGAEVFASFSLYTTGVGSCLFLVKFLRVRSVSIINKYKKELINNRYIIFVFLLLCILICSILYLLISSLLPEFGEIWFLDAIIKLPILILPIAIAMAIDWIYVVILRQSENKGFEINKTFLSIGMAYLSTSFISILLFHGFDGSELIFIIAIKDVLIITVSILYTMLKVKDFE